MKAKVLHITFFILFIILSIRSNAQDAAPIAKHKPPKTIWDIPHKTAWEKWMWIHRTAVFYITKERKVSYDTNYVKSYYKRFVITIPVSTRFLQFTLIDGKTGSKLTFSP